jgi:hypothetical protein
VKARLIELSAKVDFGKEERERAAFQKQWKENLPYSSPDFFILVGPRRSPRMDLPWLARDPVLDAQ